MIEGRRIICFGDEEWEFSGTIQRIARALAAHNEFIYVTSLGVRLPRPTIGDMKKMARRARAWIGARQRTGGAARVITPIALPLYHSVPLTRVSAWIVYRQLCRMRVFPPTPDTILWVALPTAGPVLSFLDHPRYFYQAADRHAAYPGARREVIQLCENQLAAGASFCVTSSELMAAELSKLNPRSYCIDHGVDFTHFDQHSVPAPEELKHIRRPIIGYLGGITEWVDQEALATLAARRRDWSLVLVGKDYVRTDGLLQLPNVYSLGPKPYEEVPRYIAGFDVCLMPRKLNEWQIYANPLKLLEYFCIGSPVVSSALPQIMEYGPLVYVYHNLNEIEGCVEKALVEPVGLREKRRAVARSKAHPHEVEELSQYIERHLPACNAQPSAVGSQSPQLAPP
jgi:glycosyltransferase involved in cell wall biosynthesis